MLKDILIGWGLLIALGMIVLSRHKRTFCPYCANDTDDCNCEKEAIEAANRRQTWWHEEERRLDLK